MTKKLKKPISAFSLIELSIVILIMSIIITGALSISKVSIINAKNKTTTERMNEVYKALGNFLAVNKRLPCPALFSNAKSSVSYGAEAATPGTCTSTLTGSGTGATNLRWGMVPIQALGLAEDFAEDGFETRFSYVVDRRFTEASENDADTNGFEIIQGVPSPPGSSLTIMDVKNNSTTGASATTYAIMTLISHGANKLGGYSINSGTQNSTTGITTDENTNIYVSTYDNLFVVNSTNSDFDDYIIFKTKTQLYVDAGLEYVICSQNESNRPTTAGCNFSGMQWNNTTYNDTPKTSNQTCASLDASCGGGTNPTRACGKYGIWGAITNDCT